MKNTKLVFVGVLLFSLSVGGWWWGRTGVNSHFVFPSHLQNQVQAPAKFQTQLSNVFADHQLVTAQIGNSSLLNLEIVNTPASIIQGLSGREKLGADGMLFIFNQKLKPAFWMKEMKFALDLIWIKDLKIVEITPNVPAPKGNVPLSQLPTYAPRESIEMVLEIEAGGVQEWGLEVGDEIMIKNN